MIAGTTQPQYNVARSPDLLALPGTPRIAFTGVSCRAFPLKSSISRLQDFCDGYLNFVDEREGSGHYFTPAIPFVYLQIVNYGKMSTESANLGWIAQNEVLFSVPLEWYRVEEGRLVFKDWALVCPFVFVDNDMSVATGREVYGWTKVKSWLDPIPSLWTENPRSPRRLLDLSTKVFPRLYAGESLVPRSLVEVHQNAPASLSPTVLTKDELFNPLWSIPRAVRGSMALMNDAFELFAGLPILGYARSRNVPTMGRMMRRALRNMNSVLPWITRTEVGARDVDEGGRADGSGARVNVQTPNHRGITRPRRSRPYFNQITLKQFRDAAEPDLACYQAIVNSRICVDRYYDMGMLGSLDVLMGDLSGGFQIRVHEYPGQPIVDALGLRPIAEIRNEHGAPVAILEPRLPFWLTCDLRYDLGETLCWRTKRSAWTSGAEFLPRSRPSPDQGFRGNPYNVTRGPAMQELAGPFHFPDVTLRVFPLVADWDRLSSFCDRYLNDLDWSAGSAPDPKSTVAGNRFEPWGSCIYMVVTTYGDQYGTTWTEGNNVGQFAQREAAFYVPVKWRVGDALECFSLALLTPYAFADSGRQVISDREVNGRTSLHARIESKDTWLGESGPFAEPRPLMRMKTLLIPAFHRGQPAEERTLVEIEQGGTDERFRESLEPGWQQEHIVDRERIEAGWKPAPTSRDARKGLHPAVKPGAALPPHEGESRRDDPWGEATHLFENVTKCQQSINLVHRKQYRATEHADRACYQALVLVQRRIERMFDLREMKGPFHVGIHRYPCMPVVNTLGLKVKATRAQGDHVVEYLPAHGCFFMRASLSEELGTNLCWRTNTSSWEGGPARGPSGSDHLSFGDHRRTKVGLNRALRPLIEELAEPQAVVERLLMASDSARASKRG
jgi:hypothetical protein